MSCSLQRCVAEHLALVALGLFSMALCERVAGVCDVREVCSAQSHLPQHGRPQISETLELGLRVLIRRDDFLVGRAARVVFFVSGHPSLSRPPATCRHFTPNLSETECLFCIG